MTARVTRDYSQQILDGEGDDDYARYMRTDTLLSLQRDPQEVVHRDELLFQVVHQASELWLKLGCSELDEAARRIRSGDLDGAIALLGRAGLGVELITQQLEMLRLLSPWDFQVIRTVLGHGSGADSPGWRSVQRSGRALSAAFDALLAERGIDLADLYRDHQGSPEHRLAEALVDWDERISLWRVRHYKIANRIIGKAIGTQGTPVDTLARLIEYSFVPQLWRVRSELTRTGPMGDYHVVDQ